MRDLPDSAALLALTREMLLDELLPLLPPERHRDLHLAATAIAIAMREGEGWESDVENRLARFYGVEGAPTPTLPRLRGRGINEGEGEAVPPSGQLPPPQAGEGGGGRSDPGSPQHPLLARLAADLRNGGFETSPSREIAARAILWRLVVGKLRESNPQFLAANGYK
jgi:hypothetical protein